MAYPVISVARHNVLFREESIGDTAYLLKQGRVELSKNLNGVKKVIAVLSPVTVFGEMALISDEHMRSATAVALEDVKVVEIRAGDFETLIAETPQIVQAMINILVQRLRTSTERAVHAPPPFKGTALALELLARHGVREVDADVLEDILERLFHMPAEQSRAISAEMHALEMMRTVGDSGNGRCLHLLDTEDFERFASRRREARRCVASEKKHS